jgi:hypothetical protein
MSLTPKLLQQGAAGSARPVYIEDVFSTYLYTGNGSTQTINNGIDLSGKGGLVWCKNRTTGGASTGENALFDTARGNGRYISSDLTDAQANWANTWGVTSFNANGFGVTDSGGSFYVNGSSQNYVSWTFRKQPKFFDIVTYNGNSTASRQISHNLGSTPGCIIIKSTTGGTAGYPWIVWHRSLSTDTYLQLNATDAALSSSAYVTAVSSTTFTINSSQAANLTGDSYVAYIFAHNAGGFGLTGTDNVISCGSFTTDGSGNGSISLGYEPQWLLVKASSGTGNWSLLDNMRGLPAGSFTDALLSANLTTAEADTNVAKINATGASFTNYNPSATVIYIAIRRGPMKVPTTGTSVFSPVTRTGTGANDVVTAGFPPDLALIKTTTTGSGPGTVVDRLRGAGRQLLTSQGASETSPTDAVTSFNMSSISLGSDNTYGYVNNFGWGIVNYLLRRAPGFFDEVCYTGTGTATTVSHNLGVTPEFIICKIRSNSNNWQTQVAPLGPTYGLPLNLTNAAFASSAYWNDTSPTSSVFTVGTSLLTNSSGDTFVAYLFASCPGVSKVGSYTGNGSTQTINCGFAAGARFVLIKRTDSTGDWYVFDTARGIVSGNDPFYKSNTPAAEVTAYDAVDPANAGFIVNNDSTNYPINESGATYIFLAIA